MEKQLLQIMENNSRISVKEAAALLGEKEIDVANKLKELEEKNVICGYNTMIDWDKTGIDMVTALIEVRVTPQRSKGFDDIAERIYKYPEVNTAYLISGGFDLMLILEGKSLKQVSEFVTNKLAVEEEVLSTKTHFILKRYKDHGTVMAGREHDKREKVTA
ncbi:MAG: Lrp/AsnC family transcriptional regulator [Lachnospiraceae bacterium]|nr:Lrp/AsnC family transcriptional regulator [Lachnospiraceae bacterium]